VNHKVIEKVVRTFGDFGSLIKEFSLTETSRRRRALRRTRPRAMSRRAAIARLATSFASQCSASGGFAAYARATASNVLESTSMMRRGELERGFATSARAVDAIFRTANAQRAARDAAPRRTGALAVKCGMTCDWDRWGARVPLTVLWIDACEVVSVKTTATHGYDAVQVGYGSKKPKQVTKAELGHFVKQGVGIKRALAEFRVSACGTLDVGREITAAHFIAGQYVDVSGVTKGKGFQGPMKRWGFSGQPASHGNTKKHRAHGSIGQCQDPGRVFKGKKMAGRMGGRNRTVQSVWVYKVDADKNLLYVKGQIPGNAGMMVKVKDALRKAPKFGDGGAPFPTAEPGTVRGVSVADPGPDPYIVDARDEA
jgi:large subunit ribosomal protein L3